MAGADSGTTTFQSVSHLVAPRASEPSRTERGIRARPSSVETITTGSVRSARVSEAQNRPGVPKVGAGSRSGKNISSMLPPSKYTKKPSPNTPKTIEGTPARL